MSVSDQQAMWDQKHAAHEHASVAGRPRELAEELAPRLTAGQKLLELGCGVGSDARYFADLGLDVTATDFSRVVIEQNQANPMPANLRFAVLDMTQPFSYAADVFDVVYAHLSLHYYDQAVTQAVVAEIARVLKPGGALYFSCKSVHDPKYGDGSEVQPGVFERQGHLRHFFSMDYTKTLLAKDFKVVRLVETEGTYSDGKSAFIECWAQKRAARSAS